jgi:Domain of unknown function (DUF6378)
MGLAGQNLNKHLTGLAEDAEDILLAELQDDVSAPPNNRTELLTGADRAVNGDRNAQYGDPIGDFRTTGDFWRTYLKRRFGMDVPFAPHDVAVMMNLLKASRIAWEPGKMDSWMDTAGYAACGWDCVVRGAEVYPR